MAVTDIEFNAVVEALADAMDELFKLSVLLRDNATWLQDVPSARKPRVGIVSSR